MTNCLDVSKYTIPVDVGVVQSWQAAGIRLLIIQSHPADYGQERSLEIMRAAQAAGMPFDAYVYQYLAYEDWLPGALATLDLAAAEGLLPRKVWLDVEDVDSGKGWTPEQREQAVQRDLDLCDAWLAAHGRPRASIYSAKWYWDPYLGGSSAFGDRQLWNANYDNVADTTVFTPYGGWVAQDVAIKQYAGSQPDGTDLDVLSAEEEAELTSGGNPDVTDDERTQMQTKIDSLVNSLGYLAGDVLRPLTRKSAAAYVKTAVAQIRAQAEQQGISHA